MTICEWINCRELILNLNLCFVFNVLYTIGIVYKMRLSNVVYISKILLFCKTIYWIWVPGISVTNHSEASSAELCGTNLSILIIPALALEKNNIKVPNFLPFSIEKSLQSKYNQKYFCFSIKRANTESNQQKMRP